MHYRPLRFDPPLLKRELFSIPIERVDDPALVALLREKQYELEQQLTILAERGTQRALLTSQNSTEPSTRPSSVTPTSFWNAFTIGTRTQQCRRRYRSKNR